MTRKTRRVLCYEDEDSLWSTSPPVYSVYNSWVILLILSLTDVDSNSISNIQFLCDGGKLVYFPEFKLENKNNNIYLQSFCKDYINGSWNMNHIVGPLSHTQSIVAVIIIHTFVQAVFHLLEYFFFFYRFFLCFKLGSRCTKSLKPPQTILTQHWLSLF